jgi:hypothetical protein
MDPTGMACVAVARPKRKTMGTSFFILLLPTSGLAFLISISDQLNRAFHCANGS